MDKDSSVIIDKVAYGLTIGDLKFGNTRPGVVEATLKPGFTLEDALDELDERLNAWHKKRYPHLYQDDKQPFIPGADFPPHMKTDITFGPPPVIDYGKHSQNPEDVLEEIKSAPSLEVLKTFKTIAGSPGNEELYKAYCERIKFLVK